MSFPSYDGCSFIMENYLYFNAQTRNGKPHQWYGINCTEKNGNGNPVVYISGIFEVLNGMASDLKRNK